ncbi:MAG: hypothetical protein AB1705_06610, partial [Verrucomicrobiota bacterium]
KANPSNFLKEPVRFAKQVGFYVQGAVEEFNAVYLAMGLVPFAFFPFMQKRERAWLSGLTGIYFCLAVILLILLNPAPDKQSLNLNRVFFTSSHVVISMFIGYGLALTAAVLLTNYQDFRRWALGGAAAATGVALYALASLESQFALAQFTAVFGLALGFVTVVLFTLWRAKLQFWFLMSIYLVMPAHSILTHWSDNEQRGHLFGFWFGHDMFTPPFDIYPPMARDAVLYGGTDPGRFNPTYMIFCESFIDAKYRRDPDFDRRDVYLITQNALADGTYLNYIRAHYNRSAQIDPPFFQELLRSGKEKQSNKETNVFAQLAFKVLDKPFLELGDKIEKKRRAGTSFFRPEHFTDLTSLAAKLKSGGAPAGVSQYLKENLSPKTVELLGGNDEKALRRALAADLNVLLEKELVFTTNRFAEVALTERTRRFIAQDPRSHTRIRLNRLLLEEAYPKEIEKSKGGVYPDLEIKTASVEDSSIAFEEYVQDVQRRRAIGQLRPGEDVRVEGNRLSVSGQVAVMAINAIITRIMFEKNPQHEFYVEESFPLDWMYPHLTPYGIIMKINREPLPELTEDILAKDHAFWSKFSERLIGNWITYDTPVKDICDFADRLYGRRDFTGFQGDPKFVRDENGQKAFSKLRSAIAGVYGWRINQCSTRMQEIHSKPPTEQQKLLPELERLNKEQARMVREAEFAYKQSFAFCPYSPEAVFRYVNLLLGLHQQHRNRLEDAILIATTAQKFDPENENLSGLVDTLKNMRNQQGAQTQAAPALPPTVATAPPAASLAALEAQFKAQPTNLQAAVSLVSAYLQAGKHKEVFAILDSMVESPNADYNSLSVAAEAYARLQDVPRLEKALLRLVQVLPESPEAWYDLAAIQATMRKNTNSLQSLSNALHFSDRRFKQDTNQRNLRINVSSDARFNMLRPTPEFQKLTNAPKG